MVASRPCERGLVFSDVLFSNVLMRGEVRSLRSVPLPELFGLVLQAVSFAAIEMRGEGFEPPNPDGTGS